MSDLERYPERNGARAISEKNIAALQMIVSEIAGQSQRLSEVEDRLAGIEMQAAESREWMTLMGFVRTYGVQVNTDAATMSSLGTKISRWHEQTARNYRQQASHHQVYGRVNLYQVHNLADYFNDGGYKWDFVQFGEDYL